MTEPLRVVIYAAKSTTDTKGSIPDQIEACREYAGAQGWTVDGRPESDEAASAYTGNRGDGLARAWQRTEALAAEDGRAGLLVWNSNRIARGGGDAPDAPLHLIEYLFLAQRANIELHSVTDESTFTNSIITMVMGHAAHEESKLKGANVKKGMERRRRARKHTGGSIYGYDRDKELGLKPNAQAATVRRIFEMVAGGTSQAEAARSLNREGAKPLRGKAWAQGSISKLVKTRTYLGEISAEGGEWVDAAHAGIVSADLFDAATKRRTEAAGRKGRNGGPRPKAGHLLGGVKLRHAECGASMTPVSNDEQVDGTVSGRYECSGRKAGVCAGLRVDMRDVDDTITGYLAEVGIDVGESLKRIHAGTRNRHAAAEAELQGAEADVANLDAQMTRIWAKRRAGEWDDEDWARFRADYDEEKPAVDARAAQLRKQVEQAHADPELVVPAAAEALDIIRAAVTAGRADSVRAALDALFEEFWIGAVNAMPEEFVAGSAADLKAAQARLSERIGAMELEAGRSAAEGNAVAMAEEAALPQPPPDDLTSAKGVVILPMPREDALASIIEDGEPVYLVDEHGRSAFRRVPVTMTNNDGFST